jgi:hypothetical protein
VVRASAGTIHLRHLRRLPERRREGAHLSGRVAAALMSKETAELLAKPAAIEKLDVLAAKFLR